MSLSSLTAAISDAWWCSNEAMHDLEQLLTGRPEPVSVDGDVTQ